MTDYTTICVGGLLLVGFASSFVIISRRHRRDLSEYLEPVLRRYDVKFISASYPGLFKVGPFPKFETEGGRPQITVGGARGEYNEYRIVSFSDSNGHVYQLWALVEFEMFQFRRVQWRAERKDLLPASVLPILEN